MNQPNAGMREKKVAREPYFLLFPFSFYLGLVCLQSAWSAAPPDGVGKSARTDTSPAGLQALPPMVRAREEPKPRQPAGVARALAINLETVFRLAEEQNGQIALARVRIQEACAERELAKNSWLPSLLIGPAYLRHEGGIANEDGTLTSSSFSSLFAGMEVTGRFDLREAVYQRVNAERRLWQQEGEFRRLTSETVLDAASTYIDLMTAKTGEILLMSRQKQLEDLLSGARKLATSEPGAQVEVARISTQVKRSAQVLHELREQAARASVKLAYLLGLDPSLTLVPVDEKLTALELVNAQPPVEELVAQVLANGPGVREMEGLLSLAHESIERSRGWGRYMPSVEVNMLEGGFGTGPGDRQDWDNRWDFFVKARWNLTDLLNARERQRVIQSKADQAQLAYQDLRAKLTAGVYESREAILSGRNQIPLAEEHVQEADRAYELSDKRLKNDVKGSSYAEVLLSLQGVAAAQINYVQTIRAYDKAQLRLLILMGSGNGPRP